MAKSVKARLESQARKLIRSIDKKKKKAQSRKEIENLRRKVEVLRKQNSKMAA